VDFTKLRLTGFKSFVDPTELVIEPGMTGVVGPNGCGKSNLVEALRWVMGENSAKRMRGGAMDDVIFSGTQSRPARNLAEVMMVIENKDRTAPAEFNEHDLLEISRQIERESGSTYRVNGKDVRARDVQLLFADAATGAHSPSLVSQGRIGAIINSKPTERRTLLEEAAGITGLHSRRHEAELRLRGAESNLERLDDVMQTLEGQLQNMKRQARQANRYRKVADQIRVFEGMLFHLRHLQATGRVEEAVQALATADRQVAELTAVVAEATTKQADAAESLPSLREKEAAIAAKLHRFAVARDGLEAEEQRITDATRNVKARIHQIGIDRAREQTLLADADAATARLKTERLDLEAAQEGEERSQADAMERVNQAQTVVQANETELEKLSDRIASQSALRDSIAKTIQDADNRLSRLRQRTAETDSERKHLEIAIRDDQQMQEAQEQVRLRDTAAQNQRDRLEKLEQERSDLETTSQAAREILQTADVEATKMQAEELALAKLLEMNEAELWPPLVDSLEVQPGFETALGAALGDDIQSSSDEAAPVHWKTYPAYDQTVALPAGVQPLSDMVKAPATLSRRLRQIGIVASEDGARLAKDLQPGQRLVSKDGELWRWDGFTITDRGQTSAALRLEQRNRLNEVRRQSEGLIAKAEAARETFTKAQEGTKQIRHDCEQARQSSRNAERELNEARNRLTNKEREATQRSSKLLVLKEQSEQIAADIADTEQNRVAQQDRLSRIGDLDAARTEQAEIRRKLDGLRATLIEARSAQESLRRDIESRNDRLRTIQAEIQAWLLRTQGADKQIVELRERQQASEGELVELDSKPEQIMTKRTALMDEIAKAEAERSAAGDNLANAENATRLADKAMREAEQVLAQAREHRVRIDTTLVQERERLSELVQRIREEMDCEPSLVIKRVGIENDPESWPEMAEVEAKLERLKRERERMGPVNLRAEQEAAELEEQLETMVTERQDLEAAIGRLRQGISSLNKEGRERLLTAFKEVDRHFQDLFIRLFGGGKAHLALTESDDPLEAGLEIMASPPGKRLQSLSLLSGGEQALTALALLFAVFLTNPAPICVLDEVDAPLDDANVERFCNLVTEIARVAGTRFVVITHHPYTMARMDRLFGVTMSERGVSQLLSVDLERAERMRA